MRYSNWRFLRNTVGSGDSASITATGLHARENWSPHFRNRSWKLLNSRIDSLQAIRLIMGSESSQSLWINLNSEGLKWTEEYDDLPVDGVWLRSEMLRCSPSKADVISNQDLLKLLNHTKRGGLLELPQDELITLTQSLSTETTGKFYKHIAYLTVGGRRLQLAVKFHRSRLQVESDYKNLFPLDKLYSQGAKHGYFQRELTKHTEFTWKQLRQAISTHSHAPQTQVAQEMGGPLESSFMIEPTPPPKQRQDDETEKTKETSKQSKGHSLLKSAIFGTIFVGIGVVRSRSFQFALLGLAVLLIAKSSNEGEQQAVQ